MIKPIRTHFLIAMITVRIVLGYGLDNQGSMVHFPVGGAGNFSPHPCVWNGSGAYPVSYSMGTRGSFPGGEVAGM